MKQRAELQLNAPLEYVVAARPVHFVDDAAQATLRLLKNQKGHCLISQIEACKIRLANQLETELDLSFIEQSLSLTCQRSEFVEATQAEVRSISKTIKASLKSAQLKPEQINNVFLTSGTTALPSVRNAVQAIFSDCELSLW